MYYTSHDTDAPFCDDTLVLENGLPSSLLLAAFRDGDDEMLTLVIRYYTGRLQRIARRHTGDHDLAHDLVQDTWVRVHTHRSRYEGTGPLWSWIYTIFRRVARDQWRADGRRQGREHSAHIAMYRDEDPVAETTPLDAIEQEEIRQNVQAAITVLTDRERQAIQLRHFDDQSIREIATVMGAAEGTAKATLFSARKKLAERLTHVAKMIHLE